MTGEPTSRLVLHVIDSLGRSGGAEQQLAANLSRMHDPRLVHHVLCLYEAEGGGRVEELPPGVGVTVLFPAPARIRNRLKLTVAMLEVFRSLRPSLVHCALPDAALASRLAGRALGVPVIESLVNISHEPIRTVDNPAVTPAKLAAHRLLDSATMRTVRAFHALSQAVADSWIETVGLPADKVRIIPRGVDPEEVVGPSGRPTARKRVRHELGLPDDAIVAMNVGRQVAQKGQIYALRALPAVLAKHPATVFVSAGSRGPMTGELLAEAEQLELGASVIWLGVRKDIPQLLAAADIFVFPSLYEGLGVSLLQAMAAGLPCVTTSVPPMSDIVVDSVGGLLVPRRDPHAIADAVLRLADDSALRRRLGSAAREIILSHFDLSDAARRMEAMYLETFGSSAL